MVFSQELDDVTAGDPTCHVSIESLEGVVDIEIRDSSKFLSGGFDSTLTIRDGDQKIFELLIG